VYTYFHRMYLTKPIKNKAVSFYKCCMTKKDWRILCVIPNLTYETAWLIYILYFRHLKEHSVHCTTFPYL